jgi:4'-phosphopantetheinyl transferase
MPPQFLNNTLLYQKRSIPLGHRNKYDVDWQKPTDFTQMGSSDIDIWYARLDPSFTHIPYLAEILSADEKKRAQDFHLERDRLRHIFSRGILRLILSEYLDQSPAQIKIMTGLQGKPALFQQEKEYSIHFNLSHSHEAVLYAITGVGAIGVDVEKVRDIPDMEKIIAQFFSSSERAAFDELPPTQKRQAFFSGWSRKEAFIKARGGGLSLPLDQFDVSILPDQPATLLNTYWDPLEVNNWVLSDIWLDANYTAAMAVNISGMSGQSEV